MSSASPILSTSPKPPRSSAPVLCPWELHAIHAPVCIFVYNEHIGQPLANRVETGKKMG